MTSPSSRRVSAWGLGLIAVALALDVWASFAIARLSHSWLPVQASSAAALVDDLFALEAGIGAFIFLGCCGVILWTLLFNRAPKYDLENGAPIEGNLRLEIAWTLIPLIVVMAIAWQAIQVNSTLASLGGKLRTTGGHHHGAELVARPGAGTVATRRPMAGEPLAPEGPIEVIARQWSWEFVYPNGVRSTELHLPLNRPVEFRLISLDVLHGFFIPAFRLKQDLIPGSEISYRLTPTREGRYRLRDSQFSGGYFSSNQTDVVVESEPAYRSWLEAAARLPLQEAPNPASQLYRRRLERGDRGWATVPPAPPPRVNVSADPEAPHEA
ncbi:MAG: cytochrome c oxidase subunit II [Synechococcaceae cyanobacterium]|nr:cytochrome c oxidase subunit II [Synechococcaceae cyanobacterium]